MTAALVSAVDLRAARLERETEIRLYHERWSAFAIVTIAYDDDREADLQAALVDAGLYFEDSERDEILLQAVQAADHDPAYRPEMRLERIIGTSEFVLWLENCLTRLTFDQLRRFDETAKQFVLQHNRVLMWKPAPAAKSWQLEKAWRRNHPDAAAPSFEDYPGEWPEIIDGLLRGVIPVERLVLDGLGLFDVVMDWLRDAPARDDADRGTARWYDGKRRRYVFRLDALLDLLQGVGIDTTKRKLALALRDELRCDSVPVRDSAGVYKAMAVPGRSLPQRPRLALL